MFQCHFCIRKIGDHTVCVYSVVSYCNQWSLGAGICQVGATNTVFVLLLFVHLLLSFLETKHPGILHDVVIVVPPVNTAAFGPEVGGRRASRVHDGDLAKNHRIPQVWSAGHLSFQRRVILEALEVVIHSKHMPYFMCYKVSQV